MTGHHVSIITKRFTGVISFNYHDSPVRKTVIIFSVLQMLKMRMMRDYITCPRSLARKWQNKNSDAG